MSESELLTTIMHLTISISMLLWVVSCWSLSMLEDMLERRRNKRLARESAVGE